MNERPEQPEDDGITAYHGTPHEFEQFDLSKIGTGEGAQAYGHGLYFAENEDIARHYRDALAHEFVHLDGEKVPHPSEDNPESETIYRLANHMYQMGHSADQAIEDAVGRAKKLSPNLNNLDFYKAQEAEKANKWAEDVLPYKGKKIEWRDDPGHMYEVRINAHPDHFLDWDAPLSEQSDAVRRLAGWSDEANAAYREWSRRDADSLFSELEGTGSYAPIKPPARPAGALPMSMKGHELYENLQNKFGAIDWPADADADTRAKFRGSAAQRVSQHLLDNGIKGIKYFDAGSRGDADKPTRNYVVFDDKLVNVRRRYEQGGAVDAEHMATGGEVGDDFIPHGHPDRDANFNTWFGKSTAIDGNGKPLVHYHATARDFSTFKPGGFNPEMSGSAIWLTPYKESQPAGHNVGGFEGKFKEGANVMPVYVKIEKPLFVDDSDPEGKNELRKRFGSKSFAWPMTLDDQDISAIREAGYDGIYHMKHDVDEKYDPETGRGLETIVFSPSQIKSATGNQGTFDPANPNITKATGGEAENPDIPQIDNAMSIFPKPQRMFPEDAPVAGGQYLNAATKEDMTGHKAAMASIGVQPGGKPYFRASPDSVDETGTPGRGSAIAKTNLFKQKAGWKWAQAPEGHEATDTIVSVAHRGQHHYTLNAHFPKGVDLARYENSPTEPRLRPTTKGNVTFGPKVGSILVRGKEHPVYEHVIVKNMGGEVSGKKASGGHVATLRRMSDPAVNEAIRVINRSGSSPRDAVTLSKRLLGRQ